jgi:hypothetical protein
MTANIVTANRLTDGEVVYLATSGGWTEWLAESRVAESEEETAALLAMAEAAMGDREVVDAYAMAVGRADGAITALSQRERIRALGPTTRPDLGKQAVLGRAPGRLAS